MQFQAPKQLQGFNKHTSVLNAKDEFELFRVLLDENRDDFVTLAYLIFPFGEKGHALENRKLRAWQLDILQRATDHLKNPLTRYTPFKVCVSTGNGSGKTALCCIIETILLYTYKLRGRVTANTKPQLTQVVWPEYDKWFQFARFSNTWFEKLGESIKSLDSELAEQWRFDMFTWDEGNPTAVSGLHNQGHAILYTFEEAAGIPAIIWQYARGAFAATDTIKFWLAVANSDDPDSYFESLFKDESWHRVRIDTRTLEDVDKSFIQMILNDCNGDEDHDDFRVRVRGLPRKSNADSVINALHAQKAITREGRIDPNSTVPVILTCDPAWTGGDRTTIWAHQGNVSVLLACYKLDKAMGDTHYYTYNLLCKYEKEFKADAVLIDQAEGTALFTLAQNASKWWWELISFSGSPNDKPEFKDSEYHNMRAQMYYEAAKAIAKEYVIDVGPDAGMTKEEAIKELSWSKGMRNKVSLKKQVEPKDEIKKRIGLSPDIADGFILRYSRFHFDRLPDNMPNNQYDHDRGNNEPYDPYANFTFRG